MLATFFLIVLLIIDNNVVINASSWIDEDMESIGTVYNTILFEKRNFDNEQRRNNAQMKIAFYFYKRLCYDILYQYKEYNFEKDFEKETAGNEFGAYLEKFYKNFDELFEMKSEPELMVCHFYKMFLQLNFDEILSKSEKWTLFLREKTRYFFWHDNQWKIKIEGFLKKLNWQSKENCSEIEFKNLRAYLTENSQIYVVNFYLLKSLMGDSLDFIKNIGIKSFKEYKEMKSRIFILTGPIGFDRLELTRNIVMKIGYQIPEFANFCLKTYLYGKENARIYELRMSISFLINNFLIFQHSLKKKVKESEESLKKLTKMEEKNEEKLQNLIKIKKENEENVHKNLKLNLEKFERIYGIIRKLLISVGDLDVTTEYIANVEAFLGQTLYILLKCFEISANGKPIISDESFTAMSEENLRKFYEISDNGEQILKSDESFAAMNAEYLLDKTSIMEFKSMEMKILPLIYFIEINKLLAGARADDEMQNILEKFSSIYRLASLIGGIDNLSRMSEMNRICIIRYLSGSGTLIGTKFELRFALSYFLNIFNQFRITFNASALDKQNLDKIYEQIVNDKLLQLIKVEHTLEEVKKLEEALCILLKFFEISEADSTPKVSNEKVLYYINYQQAMHCTADELEDILERQRLMLQSDHYESLKNYLSADDKDLENVLKYTDGAIYLLEELISEEKLRELWNQDQYREKMRDRKYFINKIDEIREAFGIFMTTKDEHIRQMNKTKLKIYILMRWVDLTLKGHTLKFNPYFDGLLLTWQLLFRQLLDELIVYPNDVQKIEIECTIRGGNIAKFVKKWKDNTRLTEEQIRNKYISEQDEIDILVNKYFNGNEVPSLMEEFQEIIVQSLQELVKEDKKISKIKIEDMEKTKGINLWQYFYDLHNNSEQIANLYEILDRKNIRILYEKLGLELQEDKFRVSTGESINEDQSVDSLVKMIEGGESTNKLTDDGQGMKKPTKKKLKNKKAKMNTTSATVDDGEKTKESESEKQKIESSKIIPTVGKETNREVVVKEEATAGSSSKTAAEEKRINKNKKKEKADKRKEKEEAEKIKEKEGKQKRKKNLQKFNKEFGKPKQIGMLLRATSAPRGSQIQNGILYQQSTSEIAKFPAGSSRRSHSMGKQRNGQSSLGTQQIIKLNIFKKYEFADLMKFDTLDMHYKKLMKDVNNNYEHRRFMDILVLAFEIGQRLNGIEIHKKLFSDNEIHPKLLTENEIELEKIRKEINGIKINEFEDINKLEEYFYNLLIRIELALKNNYILEENKNADKMEKIEEIIKHLHAFRFSWIIQKWKELELEGKDINRILFALNLEAGNNNEQIQIWKTILEQIKLDHDLYMERGIEEKRKNLGINEKGIEIFDLAEYSQQLYFDEEEKNLTEKLIKELEFVDVKDIERGEPIKYEWMKKFMKAKERVTNLVKEWNSNVQILFNGSYLLGTINSNSNLDIIVVTYNLKIDDKQTAECIIEEKGFDEHKKMQRERICKNDQLFICKLCKMDNVISAVKIEGYLELVKAFICEDDNYKSKSFEECQYKYEVNFLFVNIPAAVENNKFDFMKDNLQILTNKGVKSVEINKILIELYALPKRRKSFFSLLGFRDNIQMLEMMPIDGKNFRIAGAAMKLWAKRNNIYGPKLGFFKGVHMNILMAKIFMRYPTASVSFLIEQFFTTYIFWPWPMPVQLLPISELTYPRSEDGAKLWYNMDKNKNSQMPIISPGFIESNKASDIDNNTKIIMRSIMSEGLKQIREIRTGKMESGKEWSEFMQGHDLAKKYQHYLVVNCLTKIRRGSLGDDFCAIASLKMHDYIPNVIGKILPEEIDWYHIIEAGNRKKCLINGDGYSDISKYKCDIWLVGLKPKENKHIKPNEIINLENSMNEASKTMYEEYFEYKKKKSNNQLGERKKKSLEGNLLLVTNYVKKKDLNKWNIQLRGWEVIVKEN